MSHFYTENLKFEADLSTSSVPPSKTKIRQVTSGINLAGVEFQRPRGDSEISEKSDVEVLTNRSARVLLAGAGFLADAYDLFVINMVVRLLRDEHPQYVEDGRITALEGLVASSALVGAIVGQLVAGSLADIVGRKMIFVCTAVLIMFGNLGASICRDGEAMTIYHQIAFFRFFLGMGVGGEYPLAATVTSESSSASRRGTLISSVFAMQGVGSLLSVVVVALCLMAGSTNNFTWRFALAFGAAPSLIAFPWRIRMHETESFRILNRDRAKGISANRWSEIVRAFRLYKWHVVGTALSWFLLDVDFYANGLFNHDVTAQLLSRGRETSALIDARNAAILCIIAVPGYFMAVVNIEKVGRKNIQIIGFSCIGALFLVCGYGHDWFLGINETESMIPLAARQGCFLIIYSLTFFFSNFGPNTTTFLIPGEVYPPEVRATCHGLSAAMGKFGAALGAYFFPILLQTSGLSACMYVCSFVALLGVICTHFFIPTYNGSDLEIEGSYIPLDSECLRPCAEEMSLLGQGNYYQRMKKYEIPEAPVSEWLDSFDPSDGDDDVETPFSSDHTSISATPTIYSYGATD